MRFSQIETNRPEKLIIQVRNKEASAIIPRGTPCIFNLSSTPQPAAADGSAAGYEDGLQVVLPSTAGSPASILFFAGVALADIANGQLGECQVFGVAPYTLILSASRSASNATWASSQSSSSGAYALSIDTVNNCFATFTPSTPGVSWTGSSASFSTGFLDGAGQAYQALMIDSFSSLASSTSNTVVTVTKSALGYRTFVRAM
jgi:hypothetical protein